MTNDLPPKSTNKESAKSGTIEGLNFRQYYALETANRGGGIIHGHQVPVNMLTFLARKDYLEPWEGMFKLTPKGKKLVEENGSAYDEGTSAHYTFFVSQRPPPKVGSEERHFANKAAYVEHTLMAFDEFTPKTGPITELYPEQVQTLTHQGWKVLSWLGANVVRQSIGVDGLQMQQSFDVDRTGLPKVVYLKFRNEGTVSLFCGAYPHTIDTHKVPVQSATNVARKLAIRANREGI